MRFSSTGLVVDSPTPVHAVPAFADAVLRGIGQVMLQNNSYAGLIFLLGIFYNSALLGAAVLVGTAASTATALLLGLERSQVRRRLVWLQWRIDGGGAAVFLPERCAGVGLCAVHCGSHDGADGGAPAPAGHLAVAGADGAVCLHHAVFRAGLGAFWPAARHAAPAHVGAPAAERRHRGRHQCRHRGRHQCRHLCRGRFQWCGAGVFPGQCGDGG